MATLPELCPDLARHHQRHLIRLVRTWAPLADISFADLLLCVPLPDGATDADEDRAPASVPEPDDEARYRIVGHVRPTTARSIYRTDMVGVEFAPGARPLLDRARTTGTIVDGGMIGQAAAPRLRTLSVPVRHNGEIIAVMSREFSPDEQREPGELEMMYFFTFRRLAQMIAEGAYPFPVDEVEIEESPRVSDGLLLLDASARVRFASPNAVSVLTRFGVRQIEGQRLAKAGVDQRAVRNAFATRLPQTEEIERDDQTVVIRAIPISEGRELTGAVILLRDISELRRRDRLLLSKDATIAEIHHRVKNNLQTISSLLRLQGRRVVAAEARQAIDESVRRIRSIAVVHEILSQEVASDVPFEDIVRPLTRLVEEGYSSADRPLRFTVRGDAGELPTDVATPLAVVLSELLQNAVEHAFVGVDHATAEVEIRFETEEDTLDVWVTDDGVGLATDFDMGDEAGLGLTIVRSLIEGDLRGAITMASRQSPDTGTVVHLRIPRVEGRGEDLASQVGRDAPDRGSVGPVH